jgi:excisionase family DNA binding protein
MDRIDISMKHRRSNRRTTAGQVAKVLNCSTQTVYKLNRTGQLCACKVGRSLRFTSCAVANFVANNTADPGESGR